MGQRYHARARAAKRSPRVPCVVGYAGPRAGARRPGGVAAPGASAGEAQVAAELAVIRARNFDWTLGLGDVLALVFALPRRMWELGLVQFFTWIGMFSMAGHFIDYWEERKCNTWASKKSQKF